MVLPCKRNCVKSQRDLYAVVPCSFAARRQVIYKNSKASDAGSAWGPESGEGKTCRALAVFEAETDRVKSSLTSAEPVRADQFVGRRTNPV